MGSATRRKALLFELVLGISQSYIDILNLIPNDMLVFLSRTCDIDMGIDDLESSNILSQLRALDASRSKDTSRVVVD